MEYPMVEGGQNEVEDEMDYSQLQEEYGNSAGINEEIDENGQYSQFAFPSFSPTSRKRVRLRKPNFSDECIDLLIQLVNEHRDILYTKKAYTNDVHEKKIMVWTHITSKINAISSIPRTMEEVRKKWNDYSYYVKKKRENEKRGIHYTPDTRAEQSFEQEQQPPDTEGKQKVLKRDSKKIRRREDRVLGIVDCSSKDGGIDNEELNSLFMDSGDTRQQDPTYDPTYDDNDDASDQDDEMTMIPIPKNIPRSLAVPPLPNPINSYTRGSYSRGRGRAKYQARSTYTPPAPRGRGRGRGRPPSTAVQHAPRIVSPADEDLVLVNRQLLDMERKLLNVEKRRLQVEQRKLEIEEERFKWEVAERQKIYPEMEPEEENQEEEQHEMENQNTSSQDNDNESVQETEANESAEISEQQEHEPQQQQQHLLQPPQQPNELSLQDVCSPVKYETQSPEAAPQPHSPIIIPTETPSLIPVDETF